MKRESSDLPPRGFERADKLRRQAAEWFRDTVVARLQQLAKGTGDQELAGINYDQLAARFADLVEAVTLPSRSLRVRILDTMRALATNGQNMDKFLSLLPELRGVWQVQNDIDKAILDTFQAMDKTVGVKVDFPNKQK
ncbi:MAG: hypothetical protein HYV42_03645 [Candidatus Magasanikbacteria bacterium]|nr:hypothetical protein [Candidatus Magasanikbacteria bacterium]